MVYSLEFSDVQDDFWAYKEIDELSDVGNYIGCDCSSLTSAELPSTLEFLGSGFCSGANNVSELKYNGTMAEWNNVRKGSNGYEPHDAVLDIIECSDSN